MLPSLIIDSSRFCILEIEMIDKLIACNDYKAAMLYIYIARMSDRYNETQAKRDLNMDNDMYNSCVFTLKSLKIVVDPKDRVLDNRNDNKAPKYSISELMTARNTDNKFFAVCDVAESVLGKTLRQADIKTLYIIYDHLQLPADVIIELLTYLNSRGKVSRGDIEREAYYWADIGILSSKQAEEFIKMKEIERPIILQIFKHLNIIDREPTKIEESMISKFCRMGYGEREILLAIDISKNKNGRFTWKYINGILENWDKNKLYTVQDILNYDKSIKSRYNGSYKNTYTHTDSAKGELEQWEKDWLEEIKIRDATLEGAK